MQYEEVYLEERTVVGLRVRTKNTDPNMSQAIGGLWQAFFEKNMYTSILNKVGDAVIGLYDEYEKDVNGSYDMSVCVQVANEEEIPEECVIKRIPSGKYAKFKVKGNVKSAVVQFWEQLWKMDLKRSYLADFEEYTNIVDGEADITIYIAL